MWVLVVFNQDTDEVQVRGPWASEKEAQGSKKAFSKGLTNIKDIASHRLAVVGVTPMAYYDPEVHR